MLIVTAFSQAEDSLIPNGDFEADSGWAVKDGATRVEEDGNHFLRLNQTEPGKTVMVYRLVDLKPDAKALKLSFKVRYDNIKPGKKLWFDGRIMMNFKDDQNNTLKPGPGAPNFKGTSKEWKERETSFIVPEGATKLEMMFTLFQVNEGQLDFDDIKLVPTDPKPILEAQEAARVKREADVARRAAAVTAKVPVVPADQLPPMLRVQGNKVVDANGKEVWLQGVAIPSMGWGGGERVLESTEHAIKEWKANVIRLGVREHFWAGTGPYQGDGGAAYRQLVDDVVNLVASHGGYTVIDLHRFRAPEEKDAIFWAAVAAKYKDHPAVLFELFNEPHDVSWEVWRNGGRVTTEKRKDDVAAENAEELKGFHSIGHQRLVDVVRETGAKNIVIVGGLDYAYDLSGILKGYALEDKGGNGIVYSTHIYSWKSKWQEKFLDIAAVHPLFVGECGAQMERMPFIPPAQHEDATTWVPDFLGMIQKHKLHWTGWSFHPKASPCLLSSWDDYTPTPYWGEPAKRALAGEQFEMKKMR
jgi:hypothetical protein